MNSKLFYREKWVCLKKAVAEKQLGKVQQFLHYYPTLIFFVDRRRRNLLQICIATNNEIVFDYLLSVHHFDLEHRDELNETALDLALTGIGILPNRGADDFICSKHFCFKLLEKGAVPNVTHLRFAVTNSYEIADLIIENVDDINDILFDELNINSDVQYHTSFILTLILKYGASPWTKSYSGYIPFEIAVSQYISIDELDLESLFFCTFDKYTNCDIHFQVLLKLAKYRSKLFHLVLDFVEDVIIDINNEFNYNDSCHDLFLIDIDYFKLLIGKWGHKIIQALLLSLDKDIILYPNCSLDHLNYLLESEFKENMIDFIASLRSNVLLQHLVRYCVTSKEPEVTALVCFLLSYGLKLENDYDLDIIYNKFGYCDLFRLLLHFDFIVGADKCIELEYFQKQVMPVFYYNIGLDLDDFVQNPNKYATNGMENVLHYFANEEIKKLCCKYGGKSARIRSAKMYRIPLLQQLARDAFRKFFIKIFKIKNSRQFYTLVNRLPICHLHKKIITYEKQLY